jgi:ubiquinone/menaquinone biosynthesis C-methylase UbiE
MSPPFWGPFWVVFWGPFWGPIRTGTPSVEEKPSPSGSVAGRVAPMSAEVDAPTDQPDPKATVGGAFSAAAETYDQVVGFFIPFGRALVAAADPDRGVKVLDIACGRGACLYPALDAVGPDGSVLGIDLAAGMVEQLSAKGIGNAEARVGDAENLDLPDNDFDVVTGGFMIFFPPDPPRVLQELRRVLAPGGTLALSIFDGRPASRGWTTSPPNCSARRRRCRTRSSTRQQYSTTPWWRPASPARWPPT